VRIPFTALLHDRFGVEAIWWSFPLGSLCSCAMAIAYYRFGGWRKARLMGRAGGPVSAASRR